ncbi:replication-relaxation family protein [Bacillus cabrialesii]|uniref:replication-relaxation family protein n=1 Tax=Bacillus cabrialesii TaxID=2487276 RepID=UPI0028F8C1DC|nr:replication-relaxation family protein [Bacillus cabrialesii]MDU0153959.1 replication-relaxation family protein [Bacillus cabrialesii]
MRKRDKNIIEALESFRAMDRNQIAELFYSHTKSPVTNANFALKRLRDRGYIEADQNRKPYVYFPKPSRIKTNGQKVDHFLAIADFYLQLRRAGGEIKFFHVEPGYTEYVRPDACVMWRGSVWFIEVQRTHYTQKIMNDKMTKYARLYQSGEWQLLPFHKENAPFPYVWIITDHTYPIKTEGFRVFQSKSVSSFLSDLAAKQKATPKPKPVTKSSGINIKVGS